MHEKAISFYEKVYQNVFRGSNRWLPNFKARYDICMLTVTGERLTRDTFTVLLFIEKFKRKVDKLSLTAEQIYNADKRGLFSHVQPNKIYVHQKELNGA